MYTSKNRYLILIIMLSIVALPLLNDRKPSSVSHAGNKHAAPKAKKKQHKKAAAKKIKGKKKIATKSITQIGPQSHVLYPGKVLAKNLYWSGLPKEGCYKGYIPRSHRGPVTFGTPVFADLAAAGGITASPYGFLVERKSFMDTVRSYAVDSKQKKEFPKVVVYTVRTQSFGFSLPLTSFAIQAVIVTEKVACKKGDTGSGWHIYAKDEPNDVRLERDNQKFKIIATDSKKVLRVRFRGTHSEERTMRNFHERWNISSGDNFIWQPTKFPQKAIALNATVFWSPGGTPSKGLTFAQRKQKDYRQRWFTRTCELEQKASFSIKLKIDPRIPEWIYTRYFHKLSGMLDDKFIVYRKAGHYFMKHYKCRDQFGTQSQAKPARKR